MVDRLLAYPDADVVRALLGPEDFGTLSGPLECQAFAAAGRVAEAISRA